MAFRKKKTAPTTEGRWSSEEHQRFLQGMKIYGRRWTKVAEIVGTRNTVQTRSHAQKYEMKIERAAAANSNVNDNYSYNNHNSADVDPDSTAWASMVSAPMEGEGRRQSVTEWAGVVSAPMEGSDSMAMAFEAEGGHPTHELQDGPVLMMEDDSYMSSSSSSMSSSCMHSTDAQDNLASWAELAAAPQGSVGDVMGYAAWNELPGARGGQALPHQIDTETYGGMMAVGGSPMCGSKPVTPTLSEDDDFMMYLDRSGADTCSNIGMGASDLCPPPMFPSFQGTSYGYY